MHKILAACCLVLTACAADPLVPADDSNGPWRWESDLVSVRYVECEEETEEAIEFWRAQGAAYLSGQMVAADQLSASLYRQDESTIELLLVDSAEISDELDGVTATAGHPGSGVISVARSKVDVCDSKLIAHELGHALGLGHTLDNRIMRKLVTNYTRWAASLEERLWISGSW